MRANASRSSGMPSTSDWKVPSAVEPKPQDYGYDLDRALAALVGISSVVPADAFSAETLGTERAGNGVLIRGDGVVLTIGYLITEAEQVWVTFSDGRAAPGHVLGYDQETGFGLVQALARVDLPALSLGRSSDARVGERVVVGGAGGRHRSVAARIAARQEFAGYWEYVLDEAIFTAPAHPNWGGTAMIVRWSSKWLLPTGAGSSRLRACIDHADEKWIEPEVWGEDHGLAECSPSSRPGEFRRCLDFLSRVRRTRSHPDRDHARRQLF